MMRRALAVVVLVVPFVALASNSSGAPPPGKGAPKEAAGALHATSGDNKEQGLDSRLVELQATTDRHGAAPALAQATHEGMAVRGDGVVVTVEATSSTAGQRD